jgi:propane monooxygenase coupling protein
VLIAANLCFEPTVGTLLRRELGTRAAAASGDTVTPVLARAATQEWEWARAWTVAFVRFLVEDAVHGERNRAVIGDWVADWQPRAMAAAAALAPVAGRVRAYAEGMLEAALAVTTERPNPPAGTRASGRTAPNPPTESSPPETGGYDYVGIVMAKSAEGDAVARFFSGRAEVLDQPAFWEIRAVDRLVIPYDEISEELGYEIDAYSIQHEMSTHYGRMVATDDALMLFSDPTEAMEHLRS